jgi:hypothetical protein
LFTQKILTLYQKKLQLNLLQTNQLSENKQTTQFSKKEILKENDKNRKGKKMCVNKV